MDYDRGHQIPWLVVLLAVVVLLLAASHLWRQKTGPSGPQVPSSKQLELLFLGDTSYGENYQGTEQLLETRGYEYPLRQVTPLLHSSDCVIANLETPITDRKRSPYEGDKSYLHWTHPERTPNTLAKYNITSFSLANNHIMDFGRAGLRQTLAVMDAKEMNWFGAGLNERQAKKPLVETFNTSSGPFKLAVLGAFAYRRRYDVNYNFYATNDSAGAWELAPEDMKQSIARVKQEHPDAFIVIYPHWGSNYEWSSNQQQNYGRKLIDAGADLVIGHGAHCLQEIESYKGKWIIYNLGNFVFLSPGRYKAEKAPPYSLAAQLIVAGDKKRRKKWLRLYPLQTNNKVNDYQPHLLNQSEFATFKSILYEQCNKKFPGVINNNLRAGEDQIGRYLELSLT